MYIYISIHHVCIYMYVYKRILYIRIHIYIGVSPPRSLSAAARGMIMRERGPFNLGHVI